MTERENLEPGLKAEIDAMSHLDMARHWRFDKPGSRYFTGAAGDYFFKRLNELGGFTTAISKELGW